MLVKIHLRTFLTIFIYLVRDKKKIDKKNLVIFNKTFKRKTAA